LAGDLEEKIPLVPTTAELNPDAVATGLVPQPIRMKLVRI
jgi:hypothetical protein